MSKYLRRNKIPGQWAWRTIEMLESPAYRALSHTAHRFLARLEIELAHHGGRQNGRLPLTYDDLVDYGIDRHAIAPAIRELEALGFIEVTEQGRAGNAEWRRSNKFRLTYRPVDRAKETDEWKRIKTPEEAEMVAKGARRTGSNSARQKPGNSDPEENFPVGVFPESQCGNPHRKREFHSGETPTTGHGGKTHTTSRLSGRRAGEEGGDLSSDLKADGASDGMAMAAMSERCLPFGDT